MGLLPFSQGLGKTCHKRSTSSKDDCFFVNADPAPLRIRELEDLVFFTF